jgi:hypothetical protein
MQKRHVNIILGLVGIVVVICVLLVAGAAWFAVSVIDLEVADEQAAGVALDAVRAKFDGAKPLFELRSGRPSLTRAVPASGVGNLHTLHILNWDANDNSLIRAELPFALLRLKEGPINLADTIAGGHASQRAVSIRISEIERFGPALLIDDTDEAGDRILVWTE